MNNRTIYAQSSNLDLAQKWEDAVEEAVRSLLHSPQRGARCRLHSPALQGLRWIFVPGFPRHMVFYQFLADEAVLRIVQVLHGARNLETILNEDVTSRPNRDRG
ncbi:MAG TPA: type II toxin-antitoxin system RelE/ParE family toxin [Terracidiphilus sp.]